MRKLLLFLGLLVLLISPILPAQQTLDNDAVIKLAKAGLPDKLLITAINATPGNYNITVDGVAGLKTAGVSDKVIEAVVLKANGFGPRTVPAPAAVPATAPSVDSTELPSTGPNGLPVGIDVVGVYYRDKSGKWIPMQPEDVNFQSKGKIADIATVGIVRSDLDGRIEGPHASVTARLPLVFAIYLPPNVEITEYILLELHPASNARTFLSAEGGLLHTKPGAHQDQIDFQPEKLAPRLYQITLPASEGAGEYGLLAPLTRKTSNKEASGKIYTVSVAE